jgi:hypothetical protein
MRTRPGAVGERLTRALASRWAPWVLGAITAAFMWWLVGAWTPYPRVHDEASYLLQAETFALGRWSNPSPPLPIFFEQYHVFVEPGFFSKYPPGHGLLMVPGIWLGLPALVPMLLHGVAGGLLFALARRVANPWVALATWALWLGTAGNLRFRPSYFSQATSSALWLGGWWALLEWRATRRRGWLLALAACTGWLAITRPLTALAYLVPIALVCAWDIVRLRLWRDAALAFAIGTLVVGIMPLWSVATVGHVRPTPYTLYSEIYFPNDRPGFGEDLRPARRPLNADMVRFAELMRRPHQGYTPGALPAALGTRAYHTLKESLHFAPTALTLLGLVGLVASGAAGAFALASAVVLMVAYLAFAHPPEWTVYYLEIQVLPPFLAALGAWTIAAAPWGRGRTPPLATLATVRTALPPGAPAAGLLLALAPLVQLAPLAPRVRLQHTDMQVYFHNPRAAAARLEGERKIVFVRYEPRHVPHRSLIYNDPDLATSPVWWVFDRGAAENARLRALAPERVAYVLDEEMAWMGLAESARPWTPPPDLPAGQPPPRQPPPAPPRQVP